MTESQTQENDVDRMMRRVRAEVARQKALLAQEPATSPVSPVHSAPPITMPLPRFVDLPPLARKNSYAIAEFLAYHDEDFIANAYRGILGREADPGGAAAFLSALRDGRLAKAEILGRMRYSAEGRAAHIDVRGLALPFAVRTVRRIPILGRLIGIIQYVIRLPDLVRNHERLEATLFQREAETRRLINAAESIIEEGFGKLQQRADGALRDQAARLAQLRAETLPAERGAQIAKRLDEVDTAIRNAIAAHTQAVDKRLSRNEQNVQALLHELDRRKGDRDEVQAVSARIEEGLRLTREGIERLATTKADFAELQALRDARIADVAGLRADLERVARSKLDRDEVDGLVEARLETLALRELRQVLDAFGDAKVDQARLSTLADEVNALRSELAAPKALDPVRRDLVDLRRGLLDQQHRVGALLARSRRRDAPAEAIDAQAESERMLDAFFASFEDRFRGTPEEIRGRVAIYLPLVREAGAGTPDAPVLDLGCGRGDWLDLLRENGLIGIGVDVNRVTVGACRQRGLDVTESDAIAYLRTLEGGSIGAITALHVIEHLPFERLVALLDEAFRVLRPNGVAVFETPNPENLLVGSCNFWFDPTHNRPLPPESTRFFVEARGFAPVEVLRLHPHPVESRLTEGAPSVQALLNQAFYGTQDYAIVARKA